MNGTCAISRFGLVAQRANWERLGDRFAARQEALQTGDILALVALVFFATAFIGLLWWLHHLQQQRRNSNQPRHLFADLCAAHHLSRRDRRWLRQHAAAHELELHAELFVRHDLFDINRCVDEPTDKAKQRVRRLREKLFAGLEVDPVPGSPLAR